MVALTASGSWWDMGMGIQGVGVFLGRKGILVDGVLSVDLLWLNPRFSALMGWTMMVMV